MQAKYTLLESVAHSTVSVIFGQSKENFLSKLSTYVLQISSRSYKIHFPWIKLVCNKKNNILFLLTRRSQTLVKTSTNVNVRNKLQHTTQCIVHTVHRPTCCLSSEKPAVTQIHGRPSECLSHQDNSGEISHKSRK